MTPATATITTPPAICAWRAAIVSLKTWRRASDFAYSNRDYDFRDQDDDVYGGALRLAYRVRDLVTFGIEGGFENRDSNIPGLNYDDTFALLTMDINWDLGSR
jgi:hypothetical protein